MNGARLVLLRIAARRIDRGEHVDRAISNDGRCRPLRLVDALRSVILFLRVFQIRATFAPLTALAIGGIDCRATLAAGAAVPKLISEANLVRAQQADWVTELLPLDQQVLRNQ